MPYIELPEHFYSPEGVTIERDNKDFPQTVSVQNGDGKTIFTCSQSWTDEQIFKTVRIAHKAFKLGQVAGAADALENVRSYATEKKHRLTLK
jgi:hypothetical protein